MIEPLNERRRSDVVCPSLPGYGFSGKPTATGWGVGRIAEAWDELMVRLGYRALRRAGRRLGRRGDHRRSAATPATAWRSTPTCRRSQTEGPGRPDRRAGRALDRARPLPDVGFGLLQAAVDAAADAGLRPGRLAGRAAGVDRREVLVVDGLRRSSRERAEQGRTARQRDAVLGHRHRGLVGPALLGELRQLRRRRTASRCRPASPRSRRRSCVRRGAGASPTTTSRAGRRCRAAGTSPRSSSRTLFVDDVGSFFADFRY